MAIRVNCAACQKSLSVKDEYAGRTGKCPQCRAVINIPAVSNGSPENLKAPEEPHTKPKATTSIPKATQSIADASSTKPPATASNDPSQLMREILAGFKGEFPRVVPSISYRLAALVVAALMVLLPLVYVALVALLGYALYWHATENVTILSAARGYHTGRWAGLIYLGPLVIGGILILFMIKPLFARSPKQQREVEIGFTEEPILHSFVQRLCKAVNAPQPSLIEVDCEVNAAAFYRNGWWGFFRNDLGLRVGLPLLSALDTRQFGGILAHEFGHFSQGAGMRLSHVIRSINLWFVRVIYERDEWDELLVSCFDEENNWLTIIAGLTCLCIWLTRRVLWCLMIIGHTVCCVLLRQMEYDADKYEARLAGSEVFESTMRRMTELGLADMLTRQIVTANYERAGLPDNLPLCLSKVARKLPPVMESIADKIIEEERTSLFASHPASRDRISAAHRQRATGIFHLERPAKVLLKNYTAVSERATLLFYKQLIGKTAAKRQMTSTSAFLKQVEFDST